MRTCLVALALITIAGAGFGQPAPDILWTHTYGDASYAGAQCVLPTPDGGFAVSGWRNSANGGPTDGWLFKTNGDGIQSWSRTYGENGADNIQHMRPTPDGGYILCGMTTTGEHGQQAYLVKTNAEGTAQWTHNYGGTGNDFAYDVLPVDGGYVFAGYTTLSNDTAGGQQLWLVKVNNDGIQQWARTFGGDGADLAFSMDYAPDNGFYVGGYTTPADGSWDFYVIRTNSEGNAIWTRTYGASQGDYVEGIAMTSDGGAIVGGRTILENHQYSSALVIKYSASGEMQWTHAYGGDLPYAVMEIAPLGDAGYIFVGVTGLHPYDGIIYRLDPVGNVLWSRTVHNANETWLVDVKPCPNGGYIVAGMIGMEGGSTATAYLMRIAPEGPPPPPEHHYQVVPPTGLPYAVIVDSARIENEPLHQGDEIGIFDGDLCVGAGILGEHFPLTITAWQGDPEQNLPGFIVGHPMQFKLFPHDAEHDVPGDPTFSVGDGTFGFGVYSRLSLSTSLSITQVIPLRSHYFELVSLNVWPSEATAQHVFGPLEHLVAAYEDNGHVFIPPSINTLGELHQPEGYRVFVTEPETLRVTGLPLSEYQIYELHPGAWQWISYSRQIPIPIEVGMMGIAYATIIVQDADGHAWIPSQNINTIGNLIPGKGYMVRVTEDVEFTFGADAGPLSVPRLPSVATPADAPQPTGLPYAVVVHLPSSIREQGGHTIELNDGGLCVGKAFVVDGERTLVPTWQGNADYDLVGFVPGHEISLVVKSTSGEMIPVQIDGSAGAFGADSYGEIHVAGTNAMPEKFDVSEGYPNPFNPVITFTLALTNSGPVELKVVNTLGQNVYAMSMNLSAGEHHYSLDTRNFAVSPVSGMYFVKVKHDGTSVLRKVLLIR